LKLKNVHGLSAYHGGLGHILGMLLIGILFLLFKDYISLEKVSNYSEQLVGVVLIRIGFWSFNGIFKTKKEHKRTHIQVDEKPYTHVHKHEHNHSSETHQHTHKTKISQITYSSFGIGFFTWLSRNCPL
jgi:ABC-type nickel/cobalt efflux system permease component RcnA